DQAFTLGALAGELARPAHGFRLLAGALLGRLLVVDVTLHLAERALALHLLLQRLQGLVDVVVADENLDQGSLSCCTLDRPAPSTLVAGRRRANMSSDKYLAPGGLGTYGLSAAQ